MSSRVTASQQHETHCWWDAHQDTSSYRYFTFSGF